MSDAVRIVVGTFGGRSWARRAADAVDSAVAQTVPCEVVHVHSDSLGRARNLGATGGGYDWLVFLDADDQLDCHYVEAMLAGEGDLRQPATLGVYPDGHTDAQAVLIPKRRLIDANFLVIGTMISKRAWDAAGGFDPGLPYAEDWDLFLRARIAGMTVGHCQAAIYRVGVNPNSRNNQERGLQVHWYNVIRSRYAAEAHRLEAETGFVL